MGSITWRKFAEELGVVPSVRLPVGWIVLVGTAVVAIALVAGAIPARTAARSASADELRDF